MMEAAQVEVSDGLESYDEDDDSYDEEDVSDRPAERWAPLGAAASTPTPSVCDASHISETERLKVLEDEQEQLNNSLFSLTTHFAQVQFRLKQIVSAPPDEKETLLKELEEFAFKGIPDVRGCPMAGGDCQVVEEEVDNTEEHEAKILEQRKKQQELISQLKNQLEDLESYAYETGDSQLPTSKVIEKQTAIIEQLKHKLDIEDLEHFQNLSPEELKGIVDNAIHQIVNPAKVKEKLVEQLKTQIIDLERFIDFLQGEVQTPGPYAHKCTCPVHDAAGRTRTESESEKHKNLREQTVGMMKQALAVLQIFAISQFGCGGREFQKNLLKRTDKGNHWGDLRARLELTVDEVIKLQDEAEKVQPLDSDYTSDSEEAPVIQCNQALTSAVRKDMAMALRDLLQHGLMEVGQSSSLVSFGCFPSRSARSAKMMHAWDIFVKYYEMKHGKEYNEAPARKLSQSFGLEMVGGKAVTTKQTLLTAIEEVQATHVPLKRSEDSQFKAFVCLALNQRKLVPWLRLVLKTNSLVEYYYQPWSYVVKTGFSDGLQSLDKLTKLHFHLPVDLAIRPFNNIRDAF